MGTDPKTGFFGRYPLPTFFTLRVSASPFNCSSTTCPRSWPGLVLYLGVCLCVFPRLRSAFFSVSDLLHDVMPRTAGIYTRAQVQEKVVFWTSCSGNNSDFGIDQCFDPRTGAAFPQHGAGCFLRGWQCCLGCEAELFFSASLA